MGSYALGTDVFHFEKESERGERERKEREGEREERKIMGCIRILKGYLFDHLAFFSFLYQNTFFSNQTFKATKYVRFHAINNF